MKGVKSWNFHSWNDFSLVLSQKIIGIPSPKTETIDIPGGYTDIIHSFERLSELDNNYKFR